MCRLSAVVRQDAEVLLAFAGMAQEPGNLAATAGAVTGSVDDSGSRRVVIITAGEGWTGPDWDAVAKALDAGDDYLDHDYCELEDGREQWRIVYRRYA